MRWLKTLALLLGGLFLASGTAHAQAKPFAINSIAFSVLGTWYLNEDLSNNGFISLDDVVAQLKGMGATDVKVTLSAGTYARITDSLPDPSLNSNPPDDRILNFFGKLKRAGLQITVWPFTHIKFDPTNNVGTVPQPTDFNAWIAGHTDAMVRMAQLSQQGGVDRFVAVGDEISAMLFDTAKIPGFLNMVDRIRSVYRGQITSAFWTDAKVDSVGKTNLDYMDPRIFRTMDLIGISWSPYPLTRVDNPGVARLMDAFKRNAAGASIADFMRNLHTRYNKPIYISDIAFHSFVGDNYRGQDVYLPAIALTPSQQEQADLYDAFLSVLPQITGSWFLGATFDSWNRFPPDCGASQGGTARFVCSAVGENIQGKLAEGVLRNWFNGVRGWGGMEIRTIPSGAQDHLRLTAQLTVSPIDAGKPGQIYVVAFLPDGSAAVRGPAGWEAWTGGVVQSYADTALGGHSLDLIQGAADVSRLRGAKILAGYGTDLADMINQRKYMELYTVP